jgi:hypothetical protein
MRRIVFILLFAPMGLLAQKLNHADKVLIQHLKGHIQFLASEDLEGRRAGDIGEQKAVDYVIGQYQGLAIQPMGDNGFIQNLQPMLTSKSIIKKQFWIRISLLCLIVEAIILLHVHLFL